MDHILFCPMCGAFRQLVPNDEGVVKCGNCNHQTSLNKLQRKVTECSRQVPVERSKLLHRLYNQYAGKDETEVKRDHSEEALIDESCPKCSHPQLLFHTAQLRGVDEGQTVFYTCPKCGHKFTVNS